MSDTRPSEIAEIVGDETKFRTYMVLTTQDFKANLEAHRMEDKHQFLAINAELASLKERQGSTSSNVDGLQRDRSFLQGGKAAAFIIIGAIMTLASFAVAVAALLK